MRQSGAVDALVAVGIVAASVFLAWVEAIFGRFNLRRYLRARGYTLVKARWRGPTAGRQAQYRIEVQRDGHAYTGRAYLGGPWTGPFWSSKVEFDWDADIGTEDFNSV